MGLDFRIDDAPKVFINDEEKSVHEVQYMFEDLEYEFKEPTRLNIFILPAKQLEFPEGYTGDRARWAYGGFHRFRVRLAKELGLDLDMMWGFMPMELMIAEKRGIPRHNGLTYNPVPYDKWCEEQKQWWRENATKWEDLPEHPLHELLYHSDCDGDLSPESCGKVAPALRVAVTNWPEDDYDRKQALSLADMMDVCAANGRKLIFC